VRVLTSGERPNMASVGGSCACERTRTACQIQPLASARSFLSVVGSGKGERTARGLVRATWPPAASLARSPACCVAVSFSRSLPFSLSPCLALSHTPAGKCDRHNRPLSLSLFARSLALRFPLDTADRVKYSGHHFFFAQPHMQSEFTSITTAPSLDGLRSPTFPSHCEPPPPPTARARSASNFYVRD